MLGKEVTRIRKPRKAEVNIDRPDLKPHNWSMRIVSAKKQSPRQKKATLLMPEQPTRYMKPRKFDYY